MLIIHKSVGFILGEREQTTHMPNKTNADCFAVRVCCLLSNSAVRPRLTGANYRS